MPGETEIGQARTSERISRLVNEYDALCDLIRALVDSEADRERAIANCREFYDPAAASVLERIFAGHGARELLA